MDLLGISRQGESWRISLTVSSNHKTVISDTRVGSASHFSDAQHLLKVVSKKQSSKLFLAVGCAVLATFCLTAQWYSLCYALYLGVVIAPESGLPVNWLCSVAGFMVARVCLLRAQEQISGAASAAGRDSVRLALLQSWQRQPVSLIQQCSPAACASQWLEDTEAFDGFLARYWPQQYISVFSTLIILIAVYIHDWLAALLLLLSAPLIPLFMVLVGKGAEQLNKNHFVSRQRLAGHFLDRIKNLTTIKRLNAETQTLDEVAQRSDRYRDVVMKTLKIAFLSSAVLEFFSSVAIASIALYIGFSLLGAISWGPSAELTLLSGLFILLLAPEFFQPLRTFAQFYHDKAAALASAGQLILQLIPDDFNKVSSESELTSIRASASQLDIQRLTIGHSNHYPLYKNLSARLRTGQCLLVSGRSGSGKSTLLQSIAGLLPPLSGDVLFNGQPLQQHAVAYLPQQPWIINGSWGDNLKVLSPDVSEQDMLEALALLGLDSYVRGHPNGFGRLIDEQGGGISGGQMQRLALARTLLIGSEIMLLDEPTASLDPQSRDLVLSVLQKLKPSVVLILVSHDPALLTLADEHWDLSSLESLTIEK